METKDCNGNLLAQGDTVMVNKTLKVKGSSLTLKQGTVLKNIRLIDEADAKEVKVDKSVLVLKTEFLKKKS